MAQIKVENLTFSYEGSYDDIFKNASFLIDTDWKLGFIGRNGRGKTTFLKLLMGQMTYQGKISASCSFDYFPYDIEDKTLNTHDVLQTHSHFEEWQLVRELNLLEVDENVLSRPFNTLSNGEQTKVMLAALFLQQNNFLLIDEPTNHLDVEGRRIVSEYLNKKSGFILVSHDRVFLDGCVEYVLTINKANIEVQRGNFSSWYKNKLDEDKRELAENESLKKDIQRLKVSARQKGDWADISERRIYGSGNRPGFAEKSRKMQKRRKVLENRQNKQIEEKSKLLKNIEQTDDLKMFPAKHHARNLVAVSDLSIFYGDKTVCKDVSFDVEQGDRVALTGKNGSGKSSILKLILGGGIEHTGNFHIASQLSISYVSQDTSHLKGSLAEYAEANGLDLSLFKAILRQLDFSRVQFDKDMQKFSGGQKKKVLLAKSICDPAHIYIWDEPLNFIDVLSRIQIEELILKYQPTMLFVEHDSMFCKNIATKTISL